MKIKYDPEADVLIVILREGAPSNAIAQPGGVIVSYDENQEPLTLEFLNASHRQLFNPKQRHLTVSIAA